ILPRDEPALERVPVGFENTNGVGREGLDVEVAERPSILVEDADKMHAELQERHHSRRRQPSRFNGGAYGEFRAQGGAGSSAGGRALWATAGVAAPGGRLVAGYPEAGEQKLDSRATAVALPVANLAVELAHQLADDHRTKTRLSFGCLWRHSATVILDTQRRHPRLVLAQLHEDLPRPPVRESMLQRIGDQLADDDTDGRCI